MKKLVKWGIAAFLVVGVVLAVAIGGGYALLSKTITPMDGKASVSGLSQSVAIIKDQYAIPHIEAANRRDAIVALGWTHASERMWQMEVLRMAAQGRLAEMFGEKAVASDRFLKTLDLAGSAKASTLVLRKDTRDFLEAYSEGVNQWINRKRLGFEPALPVEFIILGHKPEPWEAWHSVSIVKVMALTLDANMDEEIGRLALSAKGFNPRQIEEIYPAGPRDTPPLLPDLRSIYGFGPNGKLAMANEPVLPASAPWQLQLPASNNWVISGQRTESGKPLLANDPHLGFTAPSTFYLAHLKYRDSEGEHNLIGGSLPGTPLILSGRNDRVAWGLTTTYLDSQDLFVEQINPDNPGQYRTESGFADFSTQMLEIKVKGGDPVAFERRTTRHGPVLPDGYQRLKERLPEGHVAALSWTALAQDDTTMDAALDLAEAGTVQDFFAALQAMVSPMQSIVAADVDGNIGVIAAGRVPVRSPENRIEGRAPVPGWEAIYDWQGYMEFLQKPMVINPPSGALATANANWLPATYRGHITYDWAEHFRQARVEELFVHSNAKQTMEKMIAGQADMHSAAMVQFRDEALRQLPQGVRLNEQLIASLAGWDGMMDRASPLPLIMTAWHRHLQSAMLKDDLEDNFELVEKGSITRMRNMLTSTGARNWCDNVKTPSVENCGNILFDSLGAAIAELTAEQGPVWQNWRWGIAHETVHEHRPFTQVATLEPYFTIRQQMSGGTYTLLRNSSNFAKDNPYAGIHGSALRAVYDLSDLEQSKFIISTGQSGNVLSPHYDDLVGMWSKVEYVPMVTRRESYYDNAYGKFDLVPGS
jgi:penicillin amidase